MWGSPVPMAKFRHTTFCQGKENGLEDASCFVNFLPSSADVFDRHLMRIPRKTAIGILIVYCSYNILLQTEILMYVHSTGVLDSCIG
jgi:hypothetical protein